MLLSHLGNSVATLNGAILLDNKGDLFLDKFFSFESEDFK